MKRVSVYLLLRSYVVISLTALLFLCKPTCVNKHAYTQLCCTFSGQFVCLFYVCTHAHGHIAILTNVAIVESLQGIQIHGATPMHTQLSVCR